MIEKEARTKWCPMVRTPDSGEPGVVAVNRDAAVKVNYNCIASDCMMWRYIDYEYVKPEGVPPNNRSTLEGYCGLAGK